MKDSVRLKIQTQIQTEVSDVSAQKRILPTAHI